MAGETFSGRLRTLDTVPTDTPAADATSFTDTLRPGSPALVDPFVVTSPPSGGLTLGAAAVRAVPI